MADRSIRLYLRAEIADFKRQMAEAAKAAEEPGRKARETTEQAQTHLGRMVQSATQNRQAWSTAGQALSAVGAATTALYATMLKTGIAYNTLQQTSRAALTTLLGSTEAANAQMDKLDDFARNSPFAKQVFINAQRQMIGFGVASEKVIPYLDSIQNAVAAMGGSNEDIAGIAESLAKVQSQGKITAVTFMELGRRGIDAATLIGSEMGKTGAQIRADVTAGAIGAEEALDALTAAMSKRFDGAAANVKNTFEGAMDRIKAAWRDLSSELAEPFVSAQGGGFLVDLANDAADLMRSFQALPEPVKATVAILGAAVGVTALLGGGFLLLTPRILATKLAMDQLGISTNRYVAGAGRALRATARFAGPMTLAAAATAGVAAGVKTLVQEARGVERVNATLGELVNRFTTGDEGADAYAKALGDLADAGLIASHRFGDLASAVDAVANQNAADRFFSSLSIFGQSLDADGIGETAERFKELGQALAQIADSDIARAQAEFRAMWEEAGGTAEAGANLLEIMPAYRDHLVSLATEAGVAADASTLLKIAIGEMVPGVSEASDAQRAAAAAAADAAEAYEEWFKVVADSASRFVDVVDAYDQVIDKNRELAEAAAAATKDADDSWEDFYDGATVKPKEWIKSLRDQVAEQRAWADNLVAAATKVREELPPELQEAGQALVDDFIAKGPEGADALASFVDMKPEQRQKIVSLTKEAADLATGNLQEELTNATDPYVTLDVKTDFAEIQIDNFIRETQARELNLNMTIFGRHVSTGTTPVPGRAGGGSIFGPGTETSDSIPILASNNEHMWSAREVRGAGGHGAVERLRAWARMGALRLASGGRVGWSRDQAKDAREALREAREEAKAARQAMRSAERRYQGIGTGKDNEARRAAARRDVDRARKAQRQADQAVRDAQSALRDAQARTRRLVDQRRDLRTDLRRGTIRDAVSGGGGLRVVDDLLDQSRNTDLSKKQRNRLADVAKESEKALSRLYKQSEKIEGRLAKARDRVAELAQIAGQVSGRLSGEQSLADAIVRGETSTDAYGRQSTTADTVTSRGLVAAAKAKASKIRAFAGKLQKLQKLGLSGVVLQEIAMLGSEEGSLVADAMIAGGKSDINALNAAYAEITKWSDAAGQYVTEGFYEGGLSAAEGLLKGLEDQQAAIEKQMLKIAKSMEKALKKALGIKSPSTKAREWMHDVGAGAELGLDDSRKGIESKMNSVGVSALAALQDVSDPRRGSAVPASVAPVIDLSNLSVEVTMTTDRKFAAAIWRQGGQEVARTDRAVVRGIVGVS